MRGSNLLGGGARDPLKLTHAERRAMRLAAKAWHREMKPHFDALDRAGAFSDSPTVYLRERGDG